MTYLRAPGKKRYGTALGYLQKSCIQGFQRACNNLGVLYSRKTVGMTDFRKAAVFFQDACTKGQGISCYNMGLLYKYGRGVPQSCPKAKVLFTKACQLKRQEACNTTCP
jgi:TPR repeat protein